MERGERFFTASFSGDSAFMLLASFEGAARIVDAADGRLIETAASGTARLRDTAFSPEGAGFFTASRIDAVRLWVAGSGPQRILVRLGEGIGQMVAAADQHRMAIRSTAEIHYILDGESGEAIAGVMGFPGEGSEAMAMSADGARLVTAIDGVTPIMIDINRRAVLSRFTGHTGPVLALAFSPDGNTVASASWDHTAALWKADTGEELVRLTGHMDDVTSVVFGPDGLRVATASGDATVRLWDVASGSELHSLAGHGGPIRHVAFSLDGTRLVSASDDATARMWDANTGALLTTYKGHSGPVTMTALSPGGDRLITSGAGRQDASIARLWQADTGQELIQLVYANARFKGLSFDATGAQILAATDDGQLFEVDAAPWRTEDLPGDPAQSWDERFALYKSALPSAAAPARIEGEALPLLIVTASDILTTRLTRLRAALAEPDVAATLFSAGGFVLVPGPALDALKRLCFLEGDRLFRINGAVLADAGVAANVIDAAIAAQASSLEVEFHRGSRRFIANVVTLPREEKAVNVRISRERAIEVLDSLLSQQRDASPSDQRYKASIFGELLLGPDADALSFVVLSSGGNLQDAYLSDSGYAPSDRIVEVNGEPIRRFSNYISVHKQLRDMIAEGRTAGITYGVERGEFQRLTISTVIE